MSIEVKVPSSGESIISASVARWHKNHGDAVRQGEVLVTLETDKIATELEAPADGLLAILVPEGEEVPIGAVIATITPGAAGASEPPAAAAPAAPPVVAPSAASAATPQALARTAADFSAAAVPVDRGLIAATSDGRTTRRKMSMLRRKIAAQLVSAQQTAAILTTFNEVDMTAVMELRRQVQDEFVQTHGVKLGFMSFFIKAITQALKDVPSLNTRIDGNDIIDQHYYDIGVAIGLPQGLVVPVIRNADQKSFARIELDLRDFANKARDGKITLDDLQGGVFTVSNGGTYGSLLSTPILNPPQCGILGMHTIQQRPVARDGQIVIRPMMYLALSYDHRLVDGKDAVTFLIHIKDAIESPARMLLEL